MPVLIDLFKEHRGEWLARARDFIHNELASATILEASTGFRARAGNSCATKPGFMTISAR
jgi:hypothetical protein